jgi:hypothetical protein
MTIATSFERRQTSCPRSTSTASDHCRTRGHNKAGRRLDSKRLRADATKTPRKGGRQAFREPPDGVRETGASDSRAAHQLGPCLRTCHWPGYPSWAGS